MANNDLLLLKPVEDLGNEGETVSVKSGYARNFLLPRGLAIPVTRANRKQVEALQARSEERLRKQRSVAEETAEKIRQVNIAIPVKTGPGGKVFGAITAQNLIDRLAEEGIVLDKKQVALYNPVKSLGKHTTRIKLHTEITEEFEWEVVSENPIDEEASKSDGEIA